MNKTTNQNIEEIDALNERISFIANGFTSSCHLLKGGDEEPYFVDFDRIIQDPNACRTIGGWFEYTIKLIEENEGRPDFLLFIQKEGIGTVGALLFAAYLSAKTNIPNILYRENRRIPKDKIKISDKYHTSKDKRLLNKKVLIISDVSTTGQEIRNAIKYVEREGGINHSILLYFSRLKKNVMEYFMNNDIGVYFLINFPLVRNFAYKYNTMEAKLVKKVIDKIDKQTEIKGPLLFKYESDS